MGSRRSIRRLTALWQLSVACLLLATAEKVAAADAKSDAAAVVLRAADGKTVHLTQGDLKKLPRTELEVVDHRGNKARYSGVALRAILDKLNVPRGEALRGEWLRAFVIVDAADDYRVIFAIAELDPGFTDRTIILADTRDGQPLKKFQGPFQIVVPGEKRQARWVRMVKEIRIVDSRSLEKQ
jgi:hypothetical protein